MVRRYSNSFQNQRNEKVFSQREFINEPAIIELITHSCSPYSSHMRPRQDIDAGACTY